jgi:hypothetical protein
MALHRRNTLETVTWRSASTTSTGWADVATKRDLDLLAARLRGEMHELRADVNEKLRTHLAVIMGLNVSLAGAVIAVLR